MHQYCWAKTWKGPWVPNVVSISQAPFSAIQDLAHNNEQFCIMENTECISVTWQFGAKLCGHDFKCPQRHSIPKPSHLTGVKHERLHYGKMELGSPWSQRIHYQDQLQYKQKLLAWKAFPQKEDCIWENLFSRYTTLELNFKQLLGSNKGKISWWALEKVFSLSSLRTNLSPYSIYTQRYRSSEGSLKFLTV